MSTDELVQQAVRDRPLVVRSLTRRFPLIQKAELEDASSEALKFYYEFLMNDRVDKTKPPSRFMLVTAKNVVLRTNARRNKEASIESLTNALLEPSMEREFEVRATLFVVLGRLRAKDREIIEYHSLIGMSFKEIAELRKQSIDTTERQFERAIQRARRQAVKLGLIPPPQE
jgi:DNA-directed RNA polymerase specialized sigma24 family protein